MSTVYQHPDGHEINVTRDLLTVTNDTDESVSVPIGQIGLHELGERLIELGNMKPVRGDGVIAAQKGNGLDAARNQPAKIFTKYASDFTARAISYATADSGYLLLCAVVLAQAALMFVWGVL